MPDPALEACALAQQWFYDCPDGAYQQLATGKRLMVAAYL